MVGGAVLAWLADGPASDLDAVSALDEAALAAAGGAPIGGRLGTRAWRVGGTLLEVTPLRAADLTEDLVLRDFTVHAIAARWPDGRIFDPAGGRRDRERRCLRTPLGRHSLADDPLRVLRGWRRVAHGWRWSPATAEWAAELAPALAGVAPERFGAEWLKLLVGPRVGSTLRAMADVPGLLAAMHPVLAAMVEGPPPARQAFAPWRHTSHVVEALPADAAVRLAALFHDSGKALPRLDPALGWPCPAADAPPWHAAGHATASVEVLRRTAKWWALPRAVAGRAMRIVAAHTFKPDLLSADPGARRAWLADVEDEFKTMLAFLRADKRASGRAVPVAEIDALAACLERDVAEAWPRRPAELAMDAAELFSELGTSGAARAALLDELWRWCLADPAARNQREALTTEARRRATSPTRPPDRA